MLAKSSCLLVLALATFSIAPAAALPPSAPVQDDGPTSLPSDDPLDPLDRVDQLDILLAPSEDPLLLRSPERLALELERAQLLFGLDRYEAIVTALLPVVASLDESPRVESDLADRIRSKLADILRLTDDFDAALALLDELIASGSVARRSALDAAQLQVIRGQTLRGLRRLDEALATLTTALQVLRDEGAAPLRIASALDDLGAVLIELARYDEAVAAQSEAVDLHREALGAAHPETIAQQRSLGRALTGAGRMAEAADLLTDVAATARSAPGLNGYERALPHLSLGNVLLELGRIDEARRTYAQAHEQLDSDAGGRERDRRTLRLYVDWNTARIDELVGETVRALETLERVLDEARDLWGTENSEYLSILEALGAARARSGDLVAARAHFARVLEGRRTFLRPDHPSVLQAATNLAMVDSNLGLHDQAAEQLESAIAVLENAGPSARGQLLNAYENLAQVSAQLGDHRRPVEVFERIVAVRSSIQTPSDPDLLHSRGNLVTAYYNAGLLDRAIEDGALLRADVEAVLRAGHPTRLGVASTVTRALTARNDTALGDARAALAWNRRATADVLASLDLARADSPRGAVGRSVDLFTVASDALLVADIQDRPADRQAALTNAFELLESRRAVGTLPDLVGAACVAAGSGAEAVLALRAAQRELAIFTVFPDAGSIDAIVDVAAERDRAAARLLRDLPPERVAAMEVSASELSTRLRPDEACVGYFELSPLRYDADRGRLVATETEVQALVLGFDGSLTHVRLAPVSEVEGAIRDWRRAVERGRRSEHDRGERLRELLLDPVLAVTADTAGQPARRLFVCLDRALHLIPLDALPGAEAGTRVGEDLRLHVERSFARLVDDSTDGPPGRGIVAVGALEFGGAESGPVETSAATGVPEPTAPLELAGLRSRGHSVGSWPDLPATGDEVRSIVDRFARATGEPTRLILGREATRRSLAAALPGARIVHIASHGWWTVPAAFSSAGLERRDTIQGWAPLTQCGIALSGANDSQPGPEGASGLITGEELLALDLSGCELAVVSACEGAAGNWSVGMGKHSIQAALHAAGARRVLAALWEVDDEDTAMLMEHFYAAYLDEGLSAADALRKAKLALYDAGRPIASWAAWLLTGDPD